ncbi:N-glycosidase [Lachnellula occidentalis]|uniref:N-glycosidase n=1 Tax=Lachnellula occidentalis TaxID=215460 RepID=A0A8H8RL88_9HELO|nr:N-glycosidase [Lachnellula occidentalis]
MKRQKKSSASPHVTHDGSPTNSDEPLFFYMPDTTHGEFCQWFPSTFTIGKAQISSLIGHTIDDNDAESSITFTCAEQFMMYCKAGRFHDTETQKQVLATTSPKEQKRLGKLTAGFTDASWDEVKSVVVLAGTMAKFGQNRHLKGKLLATGDRLLVEAASRDRVWGIGYTAKHAMSFRQHWGENRLGKALMEARELLRQEDAERDGHFEKDYQMNVLCTDSQDRPQSLVSGSAGNEHQVDDSYPSSIYSPSAKTYLLVIIDFHMD